MRVVFGRRLNKGGIKSKTTSVKLFQIPNTQFEILLLFSFYFFPGYETYVKQNKTIQ